MKRRIALTFTLAFAALAVAYAQTRPAPQLDGSRWTVKLTPETKGEESWENTLVFEDGKVRMTECEKYGYRPSTYTLLPKPGDAWSFEADQANDSGWKNAWRGEIKGDAIKGTLATTQKDGTVMRQSFEGKKDAK